MEKKTVRVACPCCRNKRLFDADPDSVGTIVIKCPVCRQVVAVSFPAKTGKAASRLAEYAAK